MSTSSTGQFDLIQWLIRLIAYIIDGIIVAIPTAIIYFIIVLADPTFFIFGGFLVVPFIFGVLDVLYFVFLDVYRSRTIGKMVLGLRVQTVGGGKVPIDKAFIRNISKIYWIFLLLDWLIAVVTPGSDRRQKYTDRIAGTTVVQVGRALIASTPPESPPPPPPPPPPTS